MLLFKALRHIFLDAALLYYSFAQQRDSLLRTFVYAAVAHGAAAPGYSFAVHHGDVPHRAKLLAFTAADALVRVDL